MKQFLQRALLFIAPLLVVACATQWWLYKVGETWSPERVAEEEEQNYSNGLETIYQRAISPENIRDYKLQNIQRRKPRIIAAGSSTSMQFRAHVFPGYEGEFYNAGGITNSAAQLQELSWLADNQPQIRLLIIGLDPWWFNPNSIPPQSPPLAELNRQSRTKKSLLSGLLSFRKLAELMAFNRPRLLELFRSSNETNAFAIGLSARTGAGFRGSDGSRAYPNSFKRAATSGAFVDRANTLERIRSGSNRFEFAHAADGKRLRHLDELLRMCSEREIVVIGYTIPMTGEVHKALAVSEGHRGLYDSYLTGVAQLFERHQMPLVRAELPTSFGLDSRAMIDGFHGSEVFMGNILLGLRANSKIMAVMPDLDWIALEQRVADAESDLLFVHDPSLML